MLKSNKVLVLIPARGGSKGIKDKNITSVSGKPLISYSISAAVKSKYVDDVVVTTDSRIIARVAQEYGAEVPFLRPEYLATDTAKTIDAVIHAVNWLKEHERNYDILVLLQPTQPLRLAADIDAALEKYMQERKQPLVSVRRVEEHPVLMRTIGQDGRLEHLLQTNSTVRRQDMPAYYIVDGSIYINSVKELNENTSFNDNYIPYIMPESRSVDIDVMEDVKKVEMLLSERIGMD